MRCRVCEPVYRETPKAQLEGGKDGRGFLDDALESGLALLAECVALGEFGFATQAARNGAFAFNIMRQTGHRSITTVSRYVRDAQIFRDAPASKLGL